MSTHDDEETSLPGGNLREVPWDDVSTHLGNLLNELHSLLSTIQSGFDRDNRNLALFSLGFRAAIEFERLKTWLLDSNDLLAWCVRNLYEISLTLQRVSGSDDVLKDWIGQTFTDDEDILKGFQVLREHYNPAVNERDDRLMAVLATFKSDHDFDAAGHWSVVSVARAVGRETEYRLFYKFLSKYVHPTSWIVNRDAKWTDSDGYRNLLVGMAQVLIRRIRTALETAFDLEGQVTKATVRAIPWKRSSYDAIPHATLRTAQHALRPELDRYVKRWNHSPFSLTSDDVVGLELFARNDYITQRFAWPSWPIWEEHSVQIYAAAAHFREVFKTTETTALAEEDAAIIRNLKADIGENGFEKAWAIGSSLNWPDAVVAALTVPNSASTSPA